MFHIIEDFYEPNDLGIVVLHFINLHFNSSYQSLDNYYGDRMLGYPCYQSSTMKPQENDKLNPYEIFKKTFEHKTKTKIYKLDTFFRKSKKHELKDSPSWNEHKPHVDNPIYDIAGLIYFNGASLKDGTNFYSSFDHYEPTAIVSAKVNRCVFYNSQLPHCPSMVQHVEERWVQPFFLITKEETYKSYKEKNGT